MKRPLCMVCLVFVCAVFLFTAIFPAPLYEDKVEDGVVVQQEGRVYKKEYKGDTLVLYLQNETDRFLCYVNEGTPPKLGSTIRVRGMYQSFREATNPGQFHQKRYYQILNLNFSLRNVEIKNESKEYSVWKETLYKLKQAWTNSYDTALPQKEAGTLKAMVLGEKETLNADVKELFSQSGISHVLAISGLHISLIGMGIYRLLRKIGMPAVFTAVFSVLAMCFYGMLIEAAASSLRAILMFSIYLIGKSLGRTYDMLTAICLAGAVLLMIQPLYLYHTGCLLSFLAVTGIALLNPVFVYLLPERAAKKAVLKNLSTSLSVSLFTLPVLAYYYFEIPIYSLLLNLVVIPLMSILLPLALVGGITGMFLPTAGRLILIPCQWILIFYEWSCQVTTSLPGNLHIIGQPEPFRIVLFFLIIAGVIFAYKSIRKAWIIALLSLSVAILCARGGGNTEITMLDVGQGESIFIQSADGATFLMDGGSSDVSQVGTYRLLPFFKSQGIKEITYAFVSHPDSDHYNGILECLTKSREEGVFIKYLAVSPLAFQGENPAYEQLFQAAEAAGTKVVCITAGDMLKCKKLTLTCLYPTKDSKPADTNGESLIFLLEAEGVRMLFMADAGFEQESEILDAIGDVDILKAGHHGSNTSTGEELLQTAKPEVTIISCGKNNSYGHPGWKMQERLAEANSLKYVTAESGAIRITIKRNRYKLVTYCGT